MKWLSVLVLLLPLGCRPLYLPPVPEALAGEERFSLGARAEVRHGRPLLQLEVRRLPVAGWLAVQWYAPQNRHVASESFWLGQDDLGRGLELALPEDLEVSAGRWRAILSMDGVIVRQLSVDVPASAERADE